MNAQLIAVAALAAATVTLSSAAASGGVDSRQRVTMPDSPEITDVGSSVAAKSTDDAGRTIYYTDGRWYHADGTDVRPPRTLGRGKHTR